MRFKHIANLVPVDGNKLTVDFVADIPTLKCGMWIYKLYRGRKIVYIGRTWGKGAIYNRLRKYAWPSKSQITNTRVHDFVCYHGEPIRVMGWKMPLVISKQHPDKWASINCLSAHEGKLINDNRPLLNVYKAANS